MEITLRSSVVDGKNVGMVDCAQYSGLMQGLQTVSIPGEGFRQNLNRELARQPAIARAIDFPHSASGDWISYGPVLFHSEGHPCTIIVRRNVLQRMPILDGWSANPPGSTTASPQLGSCCYAPEYLQWATLGKVHVEGIDVGAAMKKRHQRRAVGSEAYQVVIANVSSGNLPRTCDKFDFMVFDPHSRNLLP